ncbi:MAG: MOSC domain-containing protein, partial [Nocardioidaceae bacterium]
HGGRDKAVYAYAEEDADWWGDELGREVPAGLFGENLRTVGLDVTGARIGERWWVGSEDRGVLFEVRMPRTPCRNLSDRMGIDRFHDRFNSSGRVGAMLKVCTPGQVRAGDSIVVERRPQHGITVADLATGPTPEQMELLLHSGVSLATSVRNAARRVIKRAAA